MGEKTIDEINITLPLAAEQIQSLRAGQIVSLSGTVYTARDAAHKLLCEAIQNGEQLPIPLQNAAIYYCGPAPKKEGEIIGSCGPTTSSRMDAFTPALLEMGVRVMIGKGKRSCEVIKSMKKHKAIYLCAVGGAAAVIAKSVVSQRVVAYPQLLCEAIHELKFQNLSLIVGIDCYGNTILK